MILIDATFVNSFILMFKKINIFYKLSKQHHFILFLDYRLKSSLNLNVNNFEIYYLKIIYLIGNCISSNTEKISTIFH